MKGKFLLSGIVLLLCLSMITVAEAKQPLEIMRETGHVDEPFGEPTPEFYAKGVLHSILVVKSYNEGEEVFDVVGSSVQALRLYELLGSNPEYYPGEFLANLNIKMSYAGTVKPDFNVYWTGKLVLHWVINTDIELPEGLDVRGHWVIWYEEGDVKKEIGFGEGLL